MIGYLPYILFAIVSFGLFVFSAIFPNRSVKRFCLIAILTAFFLLASLKGLSVGIDTKSYQATYLKFKSASFFSVVTSWFPEVIFYSVMWCFAKLSVPFSVFLAINYLLIVIFLYFTYRNFQDGIFQLLVFLLLWFMNLSLSAIRQCVAVSITNFAFIWLIRRQHSVSPKIVFAYSALIFAATAFHAAAILMIFAPTVFLLPNDFKKASSLLLLLPFSVLLFPGVWYFGSAFLVGSGYSLYETRVSYKGVLFCLLTLLVVLYQFNWFRRLFKLDRFACKNEPNFTDCIMFMFLLVLDFFSLANYFNLTIVRISIFFYIPVGYFLMRIFSTMYNKKAMIVVQSFVIVCLGMYFIYDLPTLGNVPYELL